MRILCSDGRWEGQRCFLTFLCTSLLILMGSAFVEAVAPPRSIPYVEAICATNPDVFFCEDFEGRDIDIIPQGNVTCDSTWGNPAIEQTDICFAWGGSYQHSTAPLPGVEPTNTVWRVAKSHGFTDIMTGINTGTGNGTIAGWLKPKILGTGAKEWYTRIQVWFAPDHTWPEDYDFKMFFALPRRFVDPPSAPYEAGMYFHQDFWCSSQYFPPSGENFNDVPVIRYSSGFRQFPYQNEYCPPLSPGQAPDGAHAPRVQTGRWYTLEYHVKLASRNTGILEMWVDGIKAYSTKRVTCHDGCPKMGYILIMGWMNPADPQTGYYEIDNIVMSRHYIGPPVWLPR